MTSNNVYTILSSYIIAPFTIYILTYILRVTTFSFLSKRMTSILYDQEHWFTPISQLTISAIHKTMY
jgi:hypothetical protein